MPVLFRAAGVFAGFGIDFNGFAGLNKKGNVDLGAGFQNHGFQTALGAVAPDSGRGFGHFELNLNRQNNVDNFAFEKDRFNDRVGL